MRFTKALTAALIGLDAVAADARASNLVFVCGKAKRLLRRARQPTWSR